MSSLTRKKILIAEDDEVSRRLPETTLQKWGYEVLAVGDGSAPGTCSGRKQRRPWPSWTG